MHLTTIAPRERNGQILPVNIKDSGGNIVWFAFSLSQQLLFVKSHRVFYYGDQVYLVSLILLLLYKNDLLSAFMSAVQGLQNSLISSYELCRACWGKANYQWRRKLGDSALEWKQE